MTEREFGEIKARVHHIESDVQELKKKVDQLDTKLDKHAQAFDDKIAEATKDLHSRISSTNNKLDLAVKMFYAQVVFILLATIAFLIDKLPIFH